MMSHQSRREISPVRRETSVGNRSSKYLRRNRPYSVGWFETWSFVRNMTKERFVPSPRRLDARTIGSPGELMRTPNAINMMDGDNRINPIDATRTSTARETDIFSSPGVLHEMALETDYSR
jgi:hypothetical protein